MTKLLDDAVAAIRERSDAEQDRDAEMLLMWLCREALVDLAGETQAGRRDSLRDTEAGSFVDEPQEMISDRVERFQAAIDLGLTDLAQNRSRVVEDRGLDAYMQNWVSGPLSDCARPPRVKAAGLRVKPGLALVPPKAFAATGADA